MKPLTFLLTTFLVVCSSLCFAGGTFEYPTYAFKIDDKSPFLQPPPIGTMPQGRVHFHWTEKTPPTSNNGEYELWIYRLEDPNLGPIDDLNAMYEGNIFNVDPQYISATWQIPLRPDTEENNGDCDLCSPPIPPPFRTFELYDENNPSSIVCGRNQNVWFQWAVVHIPTSTMWFTSGSGAFAQYTPSPTDFGFDSTTPFLFDPVTGDATHFRVSGRITRT